MIKALALALMLSMPSWPRVLAPKLAQHSSPEEKKICCVLTPADASTASGFANAHDTSARPYPGGLLGAAFEESAAVLPTSGCRASSVVRSAAEPCAYDGRIREVRGKRRVGRGVV